MSSSVSSSQEVSSGDHSSGHETHVVAAIQASPIYLDLEKSVARALDLIAEAAKRKAELVVFPESWLPGYPAWLDYCRDVAIWNNPLIKRLYSRLLENSVVIPGWVTEMLGSAARSHHLTLVIGVHERAGDGWGQGSLYNSILTFGPDGRLLNRHRKLIPTFSEKLIWGPGDGLGLRAVETPVGRVGGLICWEHWMPLARQVLHTSGEVIHAALWPSVRDMHQVASRHYAFEGRCFVVAAGAIMRMSDLPSDLEMAATLTHASESDLLLDGGSAIIGPDGAYIAGPVFDKEVIVLARIDLGKVREESLTLDVAGHYSRPDIFDFALKRSPGTIPESEPLPAD